MPAPTATLPAAPAARTALPFVFATGIECSAPVVAGGLRHDQLLATGHRDRFAEDARLVRELGIPFLRYGIPFHVVARDPGRFDWAWTDRALGALADEGVEPIADLLHFGVPDGLAGFGDPRLPDLHARFVEAFAARYPWIRWYTPVNEPYITARYSGRLGWWNERGTDDDAFVRALDNVLECAVRGAAIVRAARPDAVIVQSDACDRYGPATPAAGPLAAFLNEQVYAGFDLVLGREPEPVVLAWLEQHGMGETRVASLLERAVADPFVVGLDYYAGNERLVDVDGTVTEDQAPIGFGGMAERWLDRYGRPVMLAETNRSDGVAVAWLDELWADAMALRAAGRDLVGFCWYSLTDQVDWDISLREVRGTVNPLGLVDLDRRLRPVGARYAEIARTLVAGEPGADDAVRVA